MAGFITAAPIALAKVISPLSIAVSPNPNCSINGSRNGIAPTPMRNSVPAVIDTAKVGMRSSGVGAIPFLLPLMLQLGFGLTALQSGLITFASAIGAAVMKPATQYALRTFGFRMTLTWNGTVSAVLLGLMATFRPSWPVAGLYAFLIVGGFLRSLQFTAFNTIAYADIPRERMSAATSLYSTVQQLSQTIGITVGAATLELATTLTGREAPTLWDFSVAFMVVSVFSLAATPLSFRLPASAGDEMSGHRSVAR